jgi:hypothetical protein
MLMLIVTADVVDVDVIVNFNIVVVVAVAADVVVAYDGKCFFSQRFVISLTDLSHDRSRTVDLR